ncbi:MAG: hypothetical protein LBJ04_20735 [Sphingobacterium sp.]|jgi:DNA-binding response OmpR family regulator|nr:hypothetical protein [Sphingobacterium sp.]
MLIGVPIALLSSLDEATEREHAQEIRASDYITKPYKKEELLKRIEVLIEKKKEANKKEG